MNKKLNVLLGTLTVAAMASQAWATTSGRLPPVPDYVPINQLLDGAFFRLTRDLIPGQDGVKRARRTGDVDIELKNESGVVVGTCNLLKEAVPEQGLPSKSTLKIIPRDVSKRRGNRFEVEPPIVCTPNHVRGPFTVGEIRKFSGGLLDVETPNPQVHRDRGRLAEKGYSKEELVDLALQGQLGSCFIACGFKSDDDERPSEYRCILMIQDREIAAQTQKVKLSIIEKLSRNFTNAAAKAEKKCVAAISKDVESTVQSGACDLDPGRQINSVSSAPAGSDQLSKGLSETPVQSSLEGEPAKEHSAR